LKEYSIRELAQGLQDGRWTSVDLCEMYLNRIRRYDQSGPKLNAIAEINPDLFDIAKLLDVERMTQGPRSLLHGIPLVIKDNINTYDKMHTSASSFALADFYAPYDAFVVKRLKEAGAIILGKANLSEFAYFMSTKDMPSGYGSRFGQVKSPYSETIDPLGSSTGSAVAVASNMIPVSVGTETNGSLTAPAQNNSIVTIKPTLGLVSRTGIIPISHLQDTAGPMARTVEDTAILLQAMIGKDEEDLATLLAPEQTVQFDKDYSNSIKNLTIGFLSFDNATYKAEEKEIFAEAKVILKQKAKVVKDLHFKHPKMPNFTTLTYEFKVDLNHYFSTVKDSCPIHSLKELIAFNEKHKGRCLRYGQDIFIDAEKTSGTLKEPEYIAMRKQLLKDANKLNNLMKEQGIDVIVMNQRTSHAPIAGNPCVAVPAKALTDDMPRSLFFVAKNFEDIKALQVAYHYEQATKKRVKPKL